MRARLKKLRALERQVLAQPESEKRMRLLDAIRLRIVEVECGGLDNFGLTKHPALHDVSRSRRP